MLNTAYNEDTWKLIAVYMNNVLKEIAVITFALFSMSSQLGQSCELVMGFQKKAKPPLINKEPDNSGIYFDIYSQAAKDINCGLKVIRLPKKRVLKEMKQGSIDFYPGMKFTKGRATFAYFIPNGLTTGRVGISLAKMPLITNKKELTGYSVLISLGGINYVKEVSGIKVYQVLNLDIEKAAKMLTLERGHFFATDPFVIDSFLINDEKQLFKKHPNCCGGIKPMYIGFSKKSKFFKDIINPNYNHETALSIDNYPKRIIRDSTAYQFGEAVRALAKGYQYQ